MAPTRSIRAVRAAGGSAVLAAVDEPPGSGEIISMRAAGICASDIVALANGTPWIIGHELSGVHADGTPVVIEALYGCGTCESCRTGQYNLCRTALGRGLGFGADGGMAERFRAPRRHLVELPEDLDVRDGFLAEPAAVSWHGVRIADAGPNTRVLVIGGGSVGLLAVAAAQAQDAAEVALQARYRHQMEIGERLGATEPKGRYEIVIDAAGSSSALLDGAQWLAPCGIISVLGVHYHHLEVPSTLLMIKEARLVASMGYCTHPNGRDMRQAAEMLAARPEIAEVLVTHRFPLADVTEAFRVAADRKSGAIKVALELG
ncbi:zinc-dependent alcohol dehydrogenase [Nocardia jiangxiensis]|uniref:zinc-dependent alcohol dehydrogenase n=1 Tax=Nocardia jiangxiensis TaxID=282685 RepID=UPI0003124817|nr:alcohol dehydrogenase catalytic domain-containing protein [Nocardia jiangxiensis]